jgi:hypothetical protein
MRDRMQQSRFELKYHLDEETALRVRDFVRCYIEMDEYSVGKPNFSYEVHSLYLDSDELITYWDTINGNKNRFKLRIRYYDATPDSPVFFELKRRMNHCIMKQRGGVHKRSVEWLLAGHHPDQSHLISKSSPKQLVALQRFCQIMQEIHARPKVHIAYLREAYVSDDDSFRVTMDRKVSAEVNIEGVLKTRMTEPRLCFGDDVILELKFTNRFPDWYRDLVEAFDLMQCGAAKYAEGVQNIGHRALGSRTPVVDEAPPSLRRVGADGYDRRPSPRGRVPEWVDSIGLS